jgi:hypothetical protein
MFLGYAVYCGVGIAAIVWIAPGPPAAEDGGGLKAAALVGFILAWIFLGAIWLARLAPRYEKLPRWVDNRFGPVDLALMAAMAAGLIVLLL